MAAKDVPAKTRPKSSGFLRWDLRAPGRTGRTRSRMEMTEGQDTFGFVFLKMNMLEKQVFNLFIIAYFRAGKAKVHCT